MTDFGRAYLAKKKARGGEVCEACKGGECMAHGGVVGDDLDMISRIMRKRAEKYSEGGRVANSDHGVDDEDLAGFSPNEFDDLTLRDDLEFSYTGENSGDHLGNEQEDEDRRDIISRIMRSRKLKDKMPRPA